MVLTHPNPMDNCQFQAALAFLNVAAFDGFQNGKLGVNTLQSIPGEIVNVLEVDLTGQPLQQINGFPTGNYEAAFVYQCMESKGSWINIGNCLFYQFQRGWTTQQVLQITAGVNL